MKSLRLSLPFILSALFLVSCMEEGQLTVASLSDDYVVVPEEAEVEEHHQALGQTQVVFVNFDGVTVSDCPGEVYCSDAANNRSRVIRSFFDRDTITWQPYTDQAGRQVVMEELEKAFAPYNVSFTTQRPASGPYTMLVVASNTEFSGLGVAPLDCNNQWKNDIAFVYRAEEFTPRVIANAAVHELGHSFGLAHVEERDDYMFFQAQNRLNFFTRSRYDAVHAANRCGDGTHQDAPQMLMAALGPAPYDGHFADDDGSVHEPAIDALFEAGITGGCSEGPPPKFCPDALVTRGQMAAFLSRALDLPPTTQSYFDDTVGAWFEDYANRLAAAGITMGCRERQYCGGDFVSRGQMALFLTRAFDLPPATQNYFSDTAGTHYADAANRLAEAGITMGCGNGRYCGQDPVTRGQMASFLARALGLI